MNSSNWNLYVSITLHETDNNTYVSFGRNATKIGTLNRIKSQYQIKQEDKFS